MSEIEKEQNGASHKARDVIMAFLLVLLGILLIGMLLNLVTGGTLWLWLKDNSETIRNLGIVLAAIIAMPIAFRRARAHDLQANASLEQVKINAKNQSTDIYSRAIEQLSSENLYSRVGAIFSLSKLAQDDSKAYLSIAIKNLCVFIKTGAGTGKGKHIKNEQRHSSDSKITASDISAAFSELVVLADLYDIEVDYELIDISESLLLSSQFKEIDLSKININDCVFDKSTFLNTMFTKVVEGASFRECKFFEVDFNCLFWGCDFTEADFYDCDFENTQFMDCNFTKADINGNRHNITKKSFLGDRNSLNNMHVNGEGIKEYIKNLVDD